MRPSPVAALLVSLGLLAPGAARALDNDLVLSKLGAPPGVRAGSVDPLAQERFARFAGEFAMALTPLSATIHASSGDAGFELTFSGDVAVISPSQTFSTGERLPVWPTEQTPSGALFLPTLHLRKGLPFGLEVGTHLSYVSFSSMVGVGAEVKWAILEGFTWVPDLAVRGFGSTVLGTGALSIVTAGWDAGLTERISLGGGAELALYGGFQQIGVNATTNNIDFAPNSEPSATGGGQATDDDGVFQELRLGSLLSPSHGFSRAYGGLQVRWELLVIGADFAKAWGENAIDSTGTEGTTKVALEVWKFGARIGVLF